MAAVEDLDVVDESEHPVKLVQRAGAFLDRDLVALVDATADLKLARLDEPVNHCTHVVAILPPSIDHRIDNPSRLPSDATSGT